uniref:Immunoglobulin V-set domain-containing protein n=1 Tax=Electrophorus electricus TaxID=8005 RepID=A0A4W4E066_ELEEL
MTRQGYMTKTQSRTFLTAQSGQALWAWYKQTLKHQDPQRVGTVLTGTQATASPPLDKSKFKIIRSGMSLTIPHVTEDDEGMYFCVMMDLKVMRFSYVTFLDLCVQPLQELLITGLSFQECPMHFWPVVGMGLGLGISVICNVTLTLWNWKRKNCRGELTQVKKKTVHK